VIVRREREEEDASEEMVASGSARVSPLSWRGFVGAGGCDARRARALPLDSAHLNPLCQVQLHEVVPCLLHQVRLHEGGPYP
jgi:hypothetical protein